MHIVCNLTENPSLIVKAPKIQWLSFDISVTEHEDTLLESFKEKYPWLKDLKPKQIMFVDCKATGDPAQD